MAEKHDIEWKSRWKDDYLAWICGFANSQGGKLIIGKTNDGQVVGHFHQLLTDARIPCRPEGGRQRIHDLRYPNHFKIQTFSVVLY